MKNKILILIVAFMAVNMQSFSQGNLLITPKRVVFEGNSQQAEVNLMNTGTDTATYSVSLRHYNMSEEGVLQLIEKTDSTQKIADPFLRLFPRQVTLAPGEAQIVMLQYRRKPGMKEGEYRSHIWFRSEKNYDPLGKQQTSLDSTQMSVTVTAIFGITIPVIIRTGQLNVTTSLSDFKLETGSNKSQTLQFTIHREGDYSTHGNVVVEYVPDQGKPYQIGMLKGLSVFTNIHQRAVSVKLNYVPGLVLKSGKLRVRYTSPDEAKYSIYAESLISSNDLGWMNYAIVTTK